MRWADRQADAGMARLISYCRLRYSNAALSECTGGREVINRSAIDAVRQQHRGSRAEKGNCALQEAGWGRGYACEGVRLKRLKGEDTRCAAAGGIITS